VNGGLLRKKGWVVFGRGTILWENQGCRLGGAALGCEGGLDKGGGRALGFVGGGTAVCGTGLLRGPTGPRSRGAFLYRIFPTRE